MSTKPGYEIFPCDICGSTEAIEAPYARLYTANQPLHICRGCGFVYVRERRSANEIGRVWSEEIYGDIYTAIRNPAILARQTFVLEFLNNHIPLKGLKVCDIGAGEGPFLVAARDNFGAVPFGIEPSKSNCALMTKDNVPNFCGTIEDFSASAQAKDYKADVCTIMWTLENCTSCNTMIESAYDMLKDNGTLLIATGSRLMVPFKKPIQFYLGPNPSDSHCFRFSYNSMRAVMAKNGFEPVANNRFIDNDILCVVAKKRPKSQKIEMPKDSFQAVYRFFERWHEDSAFYADYQE